MIKKSIFTYTQYKTYLLAVEQSSVVKGYRSRLAEATNCQNAFVSQVLNGEVNFSLEQALKIANFLHLQGDEYQYFLWMVEYARAGTTELKKYFSNLMQDLKEKNLNIKERVKTPQVLNSEAQSLYYSHWIYSAVHIAVMVPKLNTLAKLAEAFQLPELRIESVVQFLIEHGLVEKHGANLKSGGVQIHLQNDAANISKHHTNWRIEAIKSLEQPQDHDLHYSGVSSLSRKDAENIKALLVDVIENYVRTIEKSPEEVLYNFSMDFFSVLKKTG